MPIRYTISFQLPDVDGLGIASVDELGRMTIREDVTASENPEREARKIAKFAKRVYGTYKRQQRDYFPAPNAIHARRRLCEKGATDLQQSPLP